MVKQGEGTMMFCPGSHNTIKEMFSAPEHPAVMTTSCVLKIALVAKAHTYSRPSDIQFQE